MRRCIVVERMAEDDPEGMWAIYYDKNGITLCRPASLLDIPWERLPSILKAIRKAEKEWQK